MMQSWKFIICSGVFVAASALASAQAQEPLGDVARQERAKQKPQAAKTITNEDIPSVDVPKDVVDKDTAKDDKSDDKKDEKSASAQDKIKEMDAWKAKVAAQEAKIKDLDREINLMEREHKLKTAVFYADAGTRVRDERQWFDQERKYQADLSAKQKNLADERNKLDGIKASARKAGVGGID